MSTQHYAMQEESPDPSKINRVT